MKGCEHKAGFVSMGQTPRPPEEAGEGGVGRRSLGAWQRRSMVNGAMTAQMCRPAQGPPKNRHGRPKNRSLCTEHQQNSIQNHRRLWGEGGPCPHHHHTRQATALISQGIVFMVCAPRPGNPAAQRQVHPAARSEGMRPGAAGSPVGHTFPDLAVPGPGCAALPRGSAHVVAPVVVQGHRPAGFGHHVLAALGVQAPCRSGVSAGYRGRR